MKFKKKKPTIRGLQKELKISRDLNEQIKHSEMIQSIENNKLVSQLREKIDTHMMRERIELARALGQMIEATSKAVMFIVAKEAI